MTINLSHNIPLSYSPAISDPKLNPQKPYIINLKSIDSIHKVSEAADPKIIPAKMMVSLLKSCLTGEKADASLFKGRTYNDWVNMYNLAHDNAVLPLALDGIKNSEIKAPHDVLANMEISAAETRKYHTRQERVIKEFSEMTASHGIDTVQMKGIGFSMNYPDPQKRFGGDLDIFNFKHGTNPADSENNMSLFVDKLAKKAGAEFESTCPKHSEFFYKGIPLENHRNFLNVEHSGFQKKINDYLLKVVNPQEQVLSHGTKILVPSKEFNNIFIPFHAMQHYLGEGINFHHLTDWAVQVHKHGVQIPDEIKGSKFEQFIYAFTNLANKHLGTNVKVPENKELEDSIMRRMVHPEEPLHGVQHPKNKNPINMLIYKCKKFSATNKLYKEFFGEGATSFSKAAFESFIKHIQNPKTFKDLITKI